MNVQIVIIFAHIGKYSVHLWNSDKKKKKKSFTKTHYLAGEWKRDRKKQLPNISSLQISKVTTDVASRSLS